MCADVAQPDQARIVGINAQYFLKNSGNFVISIKASCIDSTAPPEAVFAREVRFSSHNAARLPLLSPYPCINIKHIGFLLEKFVLHMSICY